MIFLLLLLGMLILAMCLIHDSLSYDEVTWTSPNKDKTEVNSQVAHKLILEQVQLWDYAGPKTGAYYARQHNWTIRAREYVAELRIKIKEKVI